ncbi:hypothetical protein Tco_1055345 [Tanacetum coccineum]|uniref:Uncharacterized protein n=1 Tax=Tanacetum coccineum TaxID=301880 RepID=A0ABQ5GZD2_9ASTR
MTQINCSREAFKDDQYILMSSADVARSHGGDGGGDDRPPSHVVPTGCGGCFANKGKRKLNLGGRDGQIPVTRPKLLLQRSRKLKPRLDQTLFDLRPHMDSSRWTEIYEGINMHLQKAYNTNKASFKAKHWKADPTTGTYDVEAISGQLRGDTAAEVVIRFESVGASWSGGCGDDEESGDDSEGRW